MPRYSITFTITFRSLLLTDECQLTLFVIYTYIRHFKLTDSDGSPFVNIRQKPLTHITLFYISSSNTSVTKPRVYSDIKATRSSISSGAGKPTSTAPTNSGFSTRYRYGLLDLSTVTMPAQTNDPSLRLIVASLSPVQF